MALPNIVAIKFGVYTLYCRQLLDHLQALQDATRGDKRLAHTECCRRFNDWLGEFFRVSDSTNLQEATNLLGDAILGHVGFFRAKNQQAAAVFDHVVAVARSAAPDWSYQTELEILHQQGRQLARYFYANSPWPATQVRLARDAPLAYTFVHDSKDGAPVAFREQYLDEETDQLLQDVILVRFTFNCKSHWDLYLAYPYLFMHEYVSHIFAFDRGTERFNDGWLCCAAARFLGRHSWDAALNLQPPLDGDQNSASSLICEWLNPNSSLEAYHRAVLFDAQLNDEEWLLKLMWELAAYQPQAGQNDFWPDQFINRLERAMDADFPGLKRKIESIPNLRTLFEILPAE